MRNDLYQWFRVNGICSLKWLAETVQNRSSSSVKNWFLSDLRYFGSFFSAQTLWNVICGKDVIMLMHQCCTLFATAHRIKTVLSAPHAPYKLWHWSHFLACLAVNTGWWEIDIQGCYSLMKIAFAPICACKNDQRILRHNTSGSRSPDVTDQLWWRHNV